MAVICGPIVLALQRATSPPDLRGPFLQVAPIGKKCRPLKQFREQLRYAPPDHTYAGLMNRPDRIS